MNTYKPHEFAEMIGVSVKTLQRWDNEGKLKAFRSASDRRYYTHKQYVAYIGESNTKHGRTIMREQRRLSRKHESLKKRNKKSKGGEATRQNIQKQTLTVQKLHRRIANIRTNHINNAINGLVKAKPAYITIEDLNVRGMMKNRHLSKAVAGQGFSEFRTKLANKCHEYGIELRVVDRFYPSSKICHECGCIKTDLKLSDRVYRCDCGYEADRDYNASLNLRDATRYSVA